MNKGNNNQNNGGGNGIVPARVPLPDKVENAQLNLLNRLDQLPGEALSTLLLSLADHYAVEPAERYEQIWRSYYLAIMEAQIFWNANTEVIISANPISSLSQQNQELAEGNERLKSENEIRQGKQEKSNKITPVQTTRSSVFGAIDQIKQAKEKEKEHIPNCEVNNDKFTDKNN